jgi:glutathione S-transferase
MGEIDPTDSSVRTLRGLHLYHAGRSNCSGRVRLLLEEKGLPWVSHYVDIYKKENVSAAYFAINPKGLVPTLVDDGRVIVESNDILAHLEEKFTAPSFSPPSASDRGEMSVWLRRSGDLHIPAIKTYAYAKRNAALTQKTAEEAALYRSLQKDPELLEFHAKHDPGRHFSDADVAAAKAKLDSVLGEMDAILSRADWLVGDRYSLADISWAPTITTLTRAGFSFGPFAGVEAWYARIGRRPAFQRAVTDWSEAPVFGVVAMNADAAAQVRVGRG